MSLYKVIIVETNGTSDGELGNTVKAFIESVQAKKGQARVAYEGDRADVIQTIDRMLDMEKLSNAVKKP
jgi:hypothetical protein